MNSRESRLYAFLREIGASPLRILSQTSTNKFTLYSCNGRTFIVLAFEDGSWDIYQPSEVNDIETTLLNLRKYLKV